MIGGRGSGIWNPTTDPPLVNFLVEFQFGFHGRIFMSLRWFRCSFLLFCVLATCFTRNFVLAFALFCGIFVAHFQLFRVFFGLLKGGHFLLYAPSLRWLLRSFCHFAVFWSITCAVFSFKCLFAAASTLFFVVFCIFGYFRVYFYVFCLFFSGNPRDYFCGLGFVRKQI